MNDTDVFQIPFQPKSAVIDTVLLVFGIPIFFANVLGVLIVWQSTKLPFQIRLLTLNLAYSDGGIGLFMLFPREWLYKECNIRKYLLELCGTSTFLTITAFNVDRCLAIFHAVQYSLFITKTKIVVLCTVIWIFSLFDVYLLYSNEEMETVGFSCKEAFVGDLKTTNIVGHLIRLVIIVINIIIMIVLCVYLKNNLKQVSYPSLSSHVKYVDYQGTNSVKKILVITFVFLALYTPYMICELFLSTHVVTQSEYMIKALSALVSILNSFVNPFLYIFRFTECRFQLKLLFCQCNKSVIESIKRERNQSFASYTIDDRMKSRLHSLHARVLENANL
jgi:hypothetical protein